MTDNENYTTTDEYDPTDAPSCAATNLIENTDESNAVEYAHCLPRSTKSKLLDSLEFSWNMTRFTLNVDTRINIIRLNSKLHRLFDSGDWLLLPETSIIDRYHEAVFSKCPLIDEPVYRYILVAHPDMLLVPIHRQHSPPIQGKPPVDFTLHSHPYPEFPTIVSHVHPRFVLCNAGAKVVEDFEVWAKQGVPESVIRKVACIWTAWTKEVGRKRIEERAFLNRRHDNPDADDNNSERTANHRVASSALKRKLPEHQGSPTPAQKGSKRQKLADGGGWLDDETLREFDQQASMHVEERRSKKQLVLNWLNGLDRRQEERQEQ